MDVPYRLLVLYFPNRKQTPSKPLYTLNTRALPHCKHARNMTHLMQIQQYTPMPDKSHLDDPGRILSISLYQQDLKSHQMRQTFKPLLRFSETRTGLSHIREKIHSQYAIHLRGHKRNPGI